MTQAQEDAHLCGITPEHHEPLFLAQHLSAYAFARRLAAGKRVLEIGFGSGYGLNYLAEVAGETIGIDLAPGNIPRAQAQYRRPNLRFVHMPAAHLDFPDGSFDLVISFQVIEHIPEREIPAYLAEIRRVLAPNGVACLSTLNLEHNMKPGKPYEKLCYHEKEFTGPELHALLESAFPSVQLFGLYLSPAQRLYRRLKKWGLDLVGPARLNPVARFYAHATTDSFRVRRGTSPAALDLLALCRNGASTTGRVA